MAKIISSRKKYVPVKDLKVYPTNLFSFPIPEDMTYEDEPIKFEICLK